jgi:hypothetical protein
VSQVRTRPHGFGNLPPAGARRRNVEWHFVGSKRVFNLSMELEKRIRTIGRSHSFVDWEKRKGLVQEPDHLRAAIVETLAPKEKQTAADLTWQFLGIADSVFERTDDSGGRVYEVFGTQCKISGVFARTFLVAIELRLPGACSPSSTATVSVHPGH